MPTKHTIAQAKYDALHRRCYGFRLHNDIDADVIAKLASVPSMQSYIKELIRRDLAGTVCVPLSDAALNMLAEEGAKSGKSIPELIALVVDDYLIRTGR